MFGNHMYEKYIITFSYKINLYTINYFFNILYIIYKIFKKLLCREQKFHISFLIQHSNIYVFKNQYIDYYNPSYVMHSCY